jgi:hypothetical protein
MAEREVRIPEKQWWQISDVFTRIDEELAELLRQIGWSNSLLAAMLETLRGVPVTPPAPPAPPAPPVIPTVERRYLEPTPISAGGEKEVWAPASGRRIRLTRISISTDTATRIDLKWKNEPKAFESYFLPDNGTVVANFVGCNEEGPVDSPLVIISSNAATVTAKLSGYEL